MTDSITRCPKCSTSFKVKEAHLNTARGAVRCGSCLNIFNAKENLIGSVKPKTTASPAETKPPEKKPAAKIGEAPAIVDEDDDILINDDMPSADDPGAEASDELGSNVFVAKSSKSADTNLFERSNPGFNDNDDEDEAQDESWALNLLEDDDSNRESPQKEQAFFAPESEYANEAYVEEDTDSLDDDGIYSGTDYSTQNYQTGSQDAFQILDDDEEHVSDFERNPAETLFGEQERQRKKPYEEDYDEYLDGRDEITYEVGSSDHSIPNPYLESFEPEPLELHVKHRRPLLETPYFWFCLSVIAALLAIFQLAAFRFDELSRDPSYRSYYISACRSLGCSVPKLEDLSKIRVANILVAENKNRSGSLLVDSVLINNAGYEQRFPVLKLEFSSINNKILSERIYQPSDYVGGELAGSQNMPAGHPIHISLEVDDPGEEAVNYQISLISSQN